MYISCYEKSQILKQSSEDLTLYNLEVNYCVY